MKLKSLALAGTITLALAAAVSTVSAQSARMPISTQDTLIRGLGERFPNANNISKNANFQVYEFSKDGIKYVQINTLDGNVLTVVALTGRNAVVLPIGTLSSSQSVVTTNSSGPDMQPAADGDCPCSAAVVYEDAYATIVVVYGEGGKVIEVITIMKGNQLQ